MLKTTEIYLAEKHIAKEKWYEFINTISNYNGYFRSWKLIIKIEDNQIRYFVKTRCTLPTTINNLESFLLKNVDDVEAPNGYISMPYILQLVQIL